MRFDFGGRQLFYKDKTFFSFVKTFVVFFLVAVPWNRTKLSELMRLMEHHAPRLLYIFYFKELIS
jgi:hypothetical protein